MATNKQPNEEQRNEKTASKRKTFRRDAMIEPAGEETMAMRTRVFRQFGNRGGLGGPEGPPLSVALSRSGVRLDDDAALWSAIKNRTDAISGDRYERVY